MYAQPEELASYMQRSDLDNSTATLLLENASALFTREAYTWFVSTSVTWESFAPGVYQLFLPFYPVISVEEVRITDSITNAVLTLGPDYAVIKNVLYRLAG